MKYEIIGGDFPAVNCYLNPGETMITERGSMSWMSPNMNMETTTSGGIGKALGRLFAGEAMFQNRYTAVGGAGEITFASSFPGNIIAVDITPGNGIIAQKGAFLASESGVQLSVHLQKKLSSGFFGGEGFIMQKVSGNGTAFFEIDGSLVEKQLGAGESIIVNTGYLALMSESCTMEITTVPGVKNMFFGGEGFFNTVITGPGRVVLQTMPIIATANALIPYLPAVEK